MMRTIRAFAHPRKTGRRSTVVLTAAVLLAGLLTAGAAQARTPTGWSAATAAEQAVDGPSILGVVAVGEPLRAIPGDWATGAMTTYSWTVNDVEKSKGVRYQPWPDTVGGLLVLTVTAHRPEAAPESRSTSPVTIALGRLPQPAPPGIGPVNVGIAVDPQHPEVAGPTTFTYSWRIDGQEVSTAPSYVPTDADAGRTLTYTVSLHQPGMEVMTTPPSAGAVVGPRLFTTARIGITGDLAVGQTVRATIGTWIPAATVTRTWLLDGVPKGTGPTYTLTTTDHGKFLTLRVRGTAPGGYDMTVETQRRMVSGREFTQTPRPTIAGTPAVGQTLRIVAGAWSPAPTVKYQWYRSGLPIAGATASTYRVTTADRGHRINGRIQAARTAYVPVYRLSAPTAVVTPTAPTAPAPWAFTSGTRKVGVDVLPGTYMSHSTPWCSWSRSPQPSDLAFTMTGVSTTRNFVTIKPTDRYFLSKAECGVWVPVTAGQPVARMGNGVYVVDVHIQPGRYRTLDSRACTWTVYSSFGGQRSDILRTGKVGATEVTLRATDVGFSSRGCGTWQRVG